MELLDDRGRTVGSKRLNSNHVQTHHISAFIRNAPEKYAAKVTMSWEAGTNKTNFEDHGRLKLF